MLDTTITFRLDKEVKQKFKLILKEEDKTISGLLRDYIEDFIKEKGTGYEV